MAKVYAEMQFNPEIKRRSIAIVVILSVFTLGIYLPYWFLSNRSWVNDLAKEEERLTLFTPLLLLFLYSLVVFSFIPANLLLTGLPLAFFHYIESVIGYIGVALTLYIALQIRVIINSYLQNEEISLVLTVVLHVWYLQYKINEKFTVQEA